MNNRKKRMRSKETNDDELTLESWEAECRQMEEETAQSSAEIRKIMADIRADDDMDPEVRKVMLEVGESILGMDRQVKEMNATASELIAQCDAMIAKADRLERKAKRKKTTRKGKPE